MCWNHRVRFLARRSPSYRLGSVLPQTSRIHIVQNQAGSDLVLTDCVRFGPNGSNPEARQYKKIIRPASGKCFPADPDRTRIGSSMFTGLFLKIFACLHSTLQCSQRQIRCSFSFVCAPNQFVSLRTLCSMFDVLAVCAPKLLVSIGTVCSITDVSAVVCLAVLQQHLDMGSEQEDQVRNNS